MNNSFLSVESVIIIVRKAFEVWQQNNLLLGNKIALETHISGKLRNE